MTKQRLHYALLCYALLGLVALAGLSGKMRWMVWILLAALAFKSWLAYQKDRSGTS